SRTRTQISDGFCVRTVSQAPFPPPSEGKLVRLAGLEPARLSPLPPQSSVSANSTISATVDNQAVLRPKIKQNDPLPTAVPTVTQKRRNSKRFQRVGNGLLRRLCSAGRGNKKGRAMKPCL